MMISKKWITAMVGSIMLAYSAMAYGGPNEEPKTKNETETVETKVENLGTYPLRGGKVPSVEYGQRVGLSEKVYLIPFVEVIEKPGYKLGCDPALKLLCPDCPEEMFGMRKRVVGVGSELEVKLEDKVSVFGRAAFGQNGNFYATEEKNLGNSFEIGGGVKFDAELFGKDIELKVGGSYNDKFGPMATFGFVFHL